MYHVKGGLQLHGAERYLFDLNNQKHCCQNEMNPRMQALLGIHLLYQSAFAFMKDLEKGVCESQAN